MARKCCGLLSLRTCAILSAVSSLVLSIGCLLLAFFKVQSVYDIIETQPLSALALSEVKSHANIMYIAYGCYSAWILSTAPMAIGIFLEKRLLFIPWLIVTIAIAIVSVALLSIVIVYLTSPNYRSADAPLVFTALPVELLAIFVAIFGVVTVIMYYRELELEEKTGEMILNKGNKPDHKQYDAI